MLSQIIRRISNDFLQESRNSPKLLADMAYMEKYMAESYSSRIFVELLQNADDCGSHNICIYQYENNVIFANDGRAFSEQDVLAISRSGASSKERGKSIGYRGIGFKSTSYLSDEIIIYSDETYFSFCKKSCAEILGLSVGNVPTIRIPLLIENPGVSIKSEVNNLCNKGYNTVFIFRNAKVDELINELLEIREGYFIFLNNVSDCNISIGECQKTIQLTRSRTDNAIRVDFKDSEESNWLILTKYGVSLGFKYDKNHNIIVPCSKEEQTYHSYLPTYDKTAFPLKINADFSTDPSRKHITFDEKTKDALEKTSKLISEIVEDALNGKLTEEYQNILSMLTSTASFSRVNTTLKDCVRRDISSNCFLLLNNDERVKIAEYKLLPNWLEESEKRYIRIHSTEISSQSVASAVYINLLNVDTFIQQYSNMQFSTDELIKLMQERATVEKMTTETQGKVISHIIKAQKYIKSTLEECANISNIFLATDGGIKTIEDISKNNLSISSSVKEMMASSTSSGDIEWFAKEFSLRRESVQTKIENCGTGKISSSKINMKPHISKWRSAEQKCIEIESYFGNVARDVSKSNVGYDIESTTPDGKKRLIEVKSVNEGNGFSITNNEYTAAHQYGDEYYICVIFQSENNIKVMYIRNPLNCLSFEKRIRQWEWYCEDYSGEVFAFDYN